MKIVIVVSGGIVQSVLASESADLTVLDLDDMRCDAEADGTSSADLDATIAEETAGLVSLL